MPKSNSLHFFATRQDLEKVIRGVESYRSLSYVNAGTFDSISQQALSSGLQIPNLGLASSGDQNQQPWYLVVDSGIEVHVEEIPQRRGGIRYAVDQKLNPQSVAFKPSGIFEDKCVVAGQIGTCSEDDISKEILNLFVKEMRNQFVRIKSYYVGKDAADLLDRGFRLTASVQRPVEYDLTRPAS